MKRLIAYSLWGDDPKYTLGAVANAQQIQDIYPGWQARFYCGSSVPRKILDLLHRAEAELVCLPQAGDSRGMFWRFVALDEPGVERVIFRDTDSRLTTREAEAVASWLDSGLPGHIMRDHPKHAMVMLGGMWGCVSGVLPNMAQMIANFLPLNLYNQDQLFLAKHVYPLLQQHGVLVHDDFFRHEPDVTPFPSLRCSNYSFVGEAVGAQGQRDLAWREIMQFEESWHFRVRFRFHRIKRRLRSAIFGNDGFI